MGLDVSPLTDLLNFRAAPEAEAAAHKAKVAAHGRAVEAMQGGVNRYLDSRATASDTVCECLLTEDQMTLNPLATVQATVAGRRP